MQNTDDDQTSHSATAKHNIDQGQMWRQLCDREISMSRKGPRPSFTAAKKLSDTRNSYSVKRFQQLEVKILAHVTNPPQPSTLIIF